MENKCKKIRKFLKDNKYTNYIIIVLIGIAISLPLSKMCLLTTGDTTLHLLRIIGLDKSIHSSVFPYIITPSFGETLGYATNLFYPQLVTYIPFALRIFTDSYESALYLFAGLTVIFSGITMYNFTKQITENKAISLISSIIYMIYPYRLECIYERFAIGEFTAMLFLPVLFQGLYNLVVQDKKKHYYISIGAIGLLLSHTLTTVYAILFCVIFILFNLRRFFTKEVIKKCFINGIFIILCTALFIVPVIEHKHASDYIIFRSNEMQGTGEWVEQYSATFKQLFTDEGSDKTVSFNIGLSLFLGMILTIFTYKKLKDEKKQWVSIFGVMAVIALFMVTKLFPWRVMPEFLTMVQFSWRLLVFFALFISPICALNIYTIFNAIKSNWQKIIFTCVTCAIIVVPTAIRIRGYMIEKEPAIEAKKDYEQYRIDNPKISFYSINREYMPMKLYRAYVDREERDLLIPHVVEGKGDVVSCETYNDTKKIEIENCKKDTTVELPFSYYLGYKVEIKNDEKQIEQVEYTESNRGLMQIVLPEDAESCKISIYYTGTTLEKAAYVVSGLSFVGLILYIVITRKRNVNEEK